MLRCDVVFSSCDYWVSSLSTTLLMALPYLHDEAPITKTAMTIAELFAQVLGALNRAAKFKPLRHVRLREYT